MEHNRIINKIKFFFQTHKKWALIGGGVLIVLIVGAGFLFSSGTSSEGETQVLYMEATTGDITKSIEVTGSLKAVPSITLLWESEGVISNYALKVGDQIEEDQVLLSLEDSSLSSSILQAKTSLLEAQAALENLIVSNPDLYTAAQAIADQEYEIHFYKADRDYWNYNGASWDSIEKAREEYYAHEQVAWEKEAAYNTLSHLEPDDPERIAAYEEYQAALEEADVYLYKIGKLLGVDYDRSVETDFLQYDQAIGNLEQARNAYNRYLDQTEEIAAAEANVQALQNTIDQARIVAPFVGTVTEIKAVAGEMVTSGTEALRIDNLEHMMVDVYVSEVDINKVAVGQEAVLTFDALPNREYAGVVESISSAGTDESGVVEFRVSVVMEEVDDAVMPGFTAVVSIITSEETGTLLIPTQAIQTQNGEAVVMKVNSDGSTTAVAVELGAVSDMNTQVLSGDIETGDELMVVISTSEESDAGGAGMIPMPMIPGGGAGRP